jgi:hypothetical protein
MTVACSTVLAAGAATSAVAFWPGQAAAGQGHGGQSLAFGQASAADAPLGASIADLASQRAQTRAAAQKRALRAAAARAKARAAARQRAARLAAARQAASTPSPSPSAAPPSPAPSSPAPPVSAAPSGSPQHIAMSMLSSYGWSSSQFSCLDQLWERESGWNPTAANASGAYGIPQALPGSKMASAGPDWQTSATTQIKWGLGYIKGLYGSPCGAWAHSESTGWY